MTNKPNDYLLYITNKDDDHWVGILADGRIEHSDNVKFNKAARQFWECIESEYQLIRNQILNEIEADHNNDEFRQGRMK